MRQLLSLAPHFTTIEGPKKLAEANAHIAVWEKIKPNQKAMMEGKEVQFDAIQIAAAKAKAVTRKDLLERGCDETANLMNAMKDMLFDSEMGTIFGEANRIKFVCRIYPKFTRGGSTTDIFDAEWMVIGKVIGLIEDNKEYDLLSSTVLGVLPEDSVKEFIGISGKENFNMDLENSNVKGPALLTTPQNGA